MGFLDSFRKGTEPTKPQQQQNTGENRKTSSEFTDGNVRITSVAVVERELDKSTESRNNKQGKAANN